MSLACRVLRRDLARSVDGVLGPARSRRLSRHLERCPGCRTRHDLVRAGHDAGRRLGRLGPAASGRFPGFEELWAGRRAGRNARPAWAVPAVLAAAGLTALAVLAVRPALVRRGAPAAVPGPPAAGGFTPLAIREFVTSSPGRVVTEGYVHNVYFDEEERTVHIKLAENPRQPEPFVICEVRDPRGLTIPQQGSRVRVYGRSRFDAQPGRGWHEVNPVLEIAVLNR